MVKFILSTTTIFVLFDDNVFSHVQRQILDDPDPPYSFDTLFQYRYLQSLQELPFQDKFVHLDKNVPPGYVLRQIKFQKAGSKKFGPKRSFIKKYHLVQSSVWNLSSTSSLYPYIMPSHMSEEEKSFYQNYQMRQSSFGSYTKLLAFYNKPSWLEKPITFDECQVSDCRIVGKLGLHKAHAVVFSAPDLHQRKPPPRPRGQRWVYYNLESPNNTNNVTRSVLWRHQFNLTMTYRTDSDIFLPYAYFREMEDWPRRKDYDSIAGGKTKLVSIFVSNCGSASGRLEYVKQLQRYIPVDVYGKCGPLKCYSKHHKDCLDILDQYKFYLSFENSICTEYVTEKFTKLFRNINVVPVVRGGADYDKILPNGTYINADWFSSPEELARYLKRLDQEDRSYAELLRQKDRFVEVDPLPIQRAFCDLCLRLHHDNDDDIQFYDDVSQWFGHGACQAPRRFS